jgi:hypothetical protein
MMKTLQLVLLAAFLVAAVSVVPMNAADDPLSGTWTGDWGPSATDRNQVTVELKWDGNRLIGTVNPGANAVELKKATFDPKPVLFTLRLMQKTAEEIRPL